MKNSTTGGNGDSNAFKRQTIGSLLLSDEEDICFSSGGNADSNAQRRLTIGSLLMSDEEDNCFIFDDSSPEAGPVGLDRPTPPPPSRTSFYHTPTPSSNLSTTSSESDQYSSPESKCQWPAVESNSDARLMGAIVKREGHIHSIATAGDLLYTGSESKTIRVWKNQKEFTGFKSGSGLVKAIAVAGERIFSGHQDGTIRIWKASTKDPTIHKRVGTLPTFRAQIKNSLNPSNYIEIKKHRNAVWIKHTDAISCLTFSDDKSLLFSASWDKTFKIWRISDSKCLESINAHADGVNSIAAAAGGLIFTGSADGTLRAWLRQKKGKGTKHFQILLEQDFAVTAVAVNASSKYLYSGSSDGVVNFWEIDKCLRHGGTLKGHSLAVLCLTTADNLVFSGSADTSICVWRSVGGVHTCHSVLRGHGGPVKCLAVEEEKGGGDKHFIVYSGSIDKSVKIWKVPAAQPPAEVLTGTSPPHGIFDIRV